MTMAAFGTGWDIQILVHALGLSGLFAVARIAAYVKNAPWKTGTKPPVKLAAETPAPAAVRVPSVAR
jgi:hypothetical protein